MNKLSHSRHRLLKGTIAALLLSGINIKIHAQTVYGDLVEFKTLQPYLKDYQLMCKQVFKELEDDEFPPY